MFNSEFGTRSDQRNASMPIAETDRSTIETITLDDALWLQVFRLFRISRRPELAGVPFPTANAGQRPDWHNAYSLAG